MHVHERFPPGWMAVVILGVGMLAVDVAELTAQNLAGQAEESGEQAEKPPKPGEVDERIQRLIGQLGDNNYFVRERAQEELAKFSFEAFDALNAVTTHKDLEVAARAKYLLRLMRVEWTTKEDPPAVKQLLSDYETKSEKDKVAKMQRLAALPGALGAPALCRLVRFEKSPILSRRAALELLGREPPEEKLVKAVRTHLKGSRRASAAWVLTYLRLGDDLDGVIKDWTKLVEAEQKLLDANRTTKDIVAKLIRLQITWLRTAGQNDRAVATARKLIELEDGHPQKLLLLLDWLVDEKAWSVIDELYATFKSQFHENSLLLYTLAEARLTQGNKSLADETAAKALKLNPGRNSREWQKHVEVARELRVRKRYRWAANEYRHLVDQKGGDATSLTALIYCLIELKSWKEIDELAVQFPVLFGREASLLYTLAEAQWVQGKEALADETAAKAFKLNPGRSDQNLQKHIAVAGELYGRKRYRWAANEYRHLVDQKNSGDRTALMPLVFCLVQLKSWKEIEQLSARFPLLFSRKAFLLYSLALSQHELGEPEKGDKTAERALKLDPGKGIEDLIGHLMIAYRLQGHGMFRWAEAEFQYVIKTDGVRGKLAIAAQSWLAEMWHDQGEDLRAAQLLETLAKAFGDDTPDDTDISTSPLEIKRTLGDVRSRMYYFFACNAEEKSQSAKQREFLNKATAIDPADLDVLIACHQLPEQTPEYRERIRRLIKRSADKLRKEIEESPDDAAGYNQFAWLVGNTAGNMGEAMRCANKAVLLRPQSGGYLDTLAHVYFAKGDYENAVKTQNEAKKFEPHSGLIAKKLAMFKKKLEEEKNKKK